MKPIRPLCWLVFILVFIPVSLNAQFSKKWSSWEKLYEDNDIMVELRVYTPKPNSCVDKNKKFKFKYRVTGKYKSKRTYLNWKISYVDCNGLRYFQQNSLDLWKNKFEDISGGITIPVTDKDKQFTGDRIDKAFYDVKILSSKEENSGLLSPLKSEAPENIRGLDKVFVGENIELKVEGGILGEGGKWVWYIGGCGDQKVREGETITLPIRERTIIFVRAEGDNNTTNCVRKTIEVDPKSTDPNAVIGASDVCTGDDLTLSVDGGTLGVKAQWVWYKDGCGINKIGTGVSIKVRPRKNNTYYVRAESKYNLTNCASIAVNVNTPVELSGKIQASGSTSICQGESLTLSIKGSSNGSAYKWYTKSCGGRSVGSGKSISVKPYQTTTYYVRAEGACNKTTCLSKTVVVSKTSKLPALINTTTIGKKSALKISSDANLASGAKWKWYKGTCGGRSVGTGTFIKIKNSRKPARYYVRAEGNCTNVNCRSISITPVANNKKRFQDFNAIHYGLSIGLEYNLLRDISTYTVLNSIDRIDGIGIRGEASFYPLMKDYFSLGVLSSMSVGTSRYLFSGGSIPDTDPEETDKYFYTHANAGVEMAIGFSAVKILAGINKEFQYNKLDRTIGSSTLAFDNELNRDYIGIGFRIGSYKKGRNIDLLYLLYRNNQNDFSEFTNTFSNLGDRLTGFQFSWKKHNRLTLKTNMYLPITHKQLMNSSPDYDISFYTSLLINLNRFY